MNEDFFVNTWANQTTLHPLGLLILAGLCLAAVFVQREYAVLPSLLLACFVAPAQRIVVAGLDFSFVRILTIVSLLRVLGRDEFRAFVWTKLDKAMIAWGIVGSLSYILLRGTTAAVIYKLGVAIDSLGLYFLFRFLVRDLEDLRRIVVWLITLSLPVAVFLFIEKQTGRNLFSIFGGIPEFTAMRQGKLRAQGAFAHPILAGCFWVSQLPLFVALWGDGKKMPFYLGAISTLAIVYASASSTPVAGVGVVILGWAFYLLRRQLPLIRWGVFASLVMLHFAMKAPVWHLISRIDFVGGSTGYHRYTLIDQFVRRVGEWWLLGTHSTAHWGWFMFDTANMYVNEGVRGGLPTLILFVLVIGLAFQGVGRIMHNIDEQNRADYLLAWALGVSLFAHSIMFISVAYFGQIIVVWYLLLATIASLSSVTIPHAVTETESAVPRQKLVIRW